MNPKTIIAALMVLWVPNALADFASADQAFRDNDFEVAVKEYQRLAAQHDPHAETMLGLCYQNGLGVYRNNRAAMKWFGKAARQGVAQAQFFLAELYLPKDLSKAAAWLEKAAEQGDIPAQFNLGNLYLKGAGVKRDPARAFFWYGVAQRAGSPEADASFHIVEKALPIADQIRVLREIERWKPSGLPPWEVPIPVFNTAYEDLPV